MQSTVNKAPSDPNPFAPYLEHIEQPWARAVLYVLGSMLLARVISWLVTRTFRALAARTKSAVDDQIIDSLHGPIVRSVILLGLFLACLELDPRNEALWAHRGILTIGVWVWVRASLKSAALLLQAMSRRQGKFLTVEPRTLPLFDNVVKVGLVLLAGYVLFRIWGWDPSAWLASAGVAGIAIGFAAKDTIANLFAGVFIIADSPYTVGDFIVLDSGYRGRVLHIGLRSTRILTRDDVHITIPNSVIGNAALVNETAGSPQYRLKVKVGVAYGSDLDEVRSALLDVASKSTCILQVPEPRVRLRNFGDSALDFELQVWIRMPEMRGQTYDDLYTAIYKRFAVDGIEIAFPQQDLYLRSVPGEWFPGAGTAKGGGKSE
jgi:MscS family membrane protein